MTRTIARRWRSPARRTWLAATAALVTAGALAAPLVVAAPAFADPATIRLTPDQVRALSARYTVGNDVNGTVEQRLATSNTAPTAPGHNQNATPSTGGGIALQLNNEVETSRGLGLTTAIPGTGDWYHVDTSGQVIRVGGDGRPKWTKTEQSFVADWGLKGTTPWLPLPPKLDMFAGYDPFSASSSTSDQTFAVGDFGGGSGQDIAVTYTLGETAEFPFTVPDSTLTHLASFVTVIDGRTGQMLWHKVYPGVVSRLAAVDHGLVVADVTGPSWGLEPVAEQGNSRSNLSLVTFRQHHASIAWTYTANVPWAAWTGLTPTADGIAAAWTDTPMGLGSPRPADGHLLMLDPRTGTARFSVATAGYPRLLRDDPQRHRLVAVEQNDPTDAITWQLVAVDPRTGARTVLANHAGSLPTSLRVADADRRNPAYVTTELVMNPNTLKPTGSTVLAFDTCGGLAWTTPVPAAFPGDVPVVGGLILPDARRDTVVLTTQDPQPASSANPAGPEGTQIISLDARTGAPRWSHAGAVATGLEPAQFANTILSVAADNTGYAYRISDGRTMATVPQLGDLYAGTLADNGKTLITGGQSRGVFALDTQQQPFGAPKVRWVATVQGAVHQIQSVDNGREVLVTATGGWDLIDTHTGVVRTAVDLPGTYTWTTTTVGTGRDTEIIVPTNRLAGYGLDGRQRWSFAPAGSPVRFSSATVDRDGRVIAEYGTAAGDKSPAHGVVALDASSGRVDWQRAADASVTGADLLGAVYASPDIPAANGHAVALAWAATGGVAGSTLVEIRDARTGAVLATHTDGGGFTHIGFISAPGLGLTQLHFAQLTRLMPDGKTWADVGTAGMDYSGGYATSTGGSTVLVTSPAGEQVYDPAAINPSADGWPTELARSAPIDDAWQLSVQGAQVLGFQQDAREWAVNFSWTGGYYYDPDVNMHGVTVETITGKLTGAPAKATPKVAAPAQPSKPSFTYGDPVSGTGWGDGQMHSDAIVDAPTNAATQALRGYTPAQLQHNLALAGDGSGQTVAIVDAYHHPRITDDLNTFSRQFGLPVSCGSAAKGADCVDFSVRPMPGMQPQQGDWDGETALDVEWVHAIAPHARIVLVEAANSDAAGMYAAVDAAAALHPAAISMSWGQGHEFSGEAFYDHHCVLADSVCVESAGDAGNPAGYGAVAPTVLAIGGTTLKLDAAGNMLSQTAWRGSGGGVSYFEPRPAFQNGVNPFANRGTPDVSAVADPATGVAVYVTSSATGQGQWMQIGGTSLSAPIWSAILAAADAARAAAGKAPLASANGSVFSAIYGLGSALVDVTSGSNGPCPAAVCSAHPGYDTVTGLGTPGPGIDRALAVK